MARVQTAIGLLVALAGVALVVAWLRWPASEKKDHDSLIQSELVRLERSREPRERIDAAKQLAVLPPVISSTDLQKLGNALLHDADPRVRAQVAATIGESRRKLETDREVQAFNEPQFLEILAMAYAAEGDASVRREIVIAAGEFNHFDAGALLALAIEDADLSVSEQAQRTKLAREMRILKSRIG